MDEDLADYIHKLKVSDDLFKDIKFYATGKIPDEVLKLLTDGGAKQDAHITDFMTHLVTGEDPNENDVGVVKDIYEKPVVTQRWPSPAPRAIAQTTAAGLRQVATPPTTELTDPSESDASPSRPISAQGLRAGLQQTAASSGPSSSMGPAQTTNARSSAQLEAPSPANTTSMAQPTQGNVARATPPIPSRVTPPNTSRATPPNTARATPPNNALRVTPPNASRTTPPSTSRATPPNTSRETPPARTTPTPPMSSRATPPSTTHTPSPITSRATPPTTARATPPVISRGNPPVVGPAGPRVPAMPLTVTNPGVRAPGAVSQVAPGEIPIPNMPQQVHTVAIPGAVVRLPQGVTPRKLQMMTPTERHSFLQNLHQKQLQEQQSRGKPRAGKPPGPQYKQGVRYAAAGIHTPGTPATPGTQVSSWPGTGQGTPVVRPAMAGSGPGTIAVSYQSGQVQGQTPGAPQVVTAVTPGEGVRPGWPGPGQQQQYPGGQPQPGTRVVVGQTSWQQQQQQSGIRAQAPATPGQQPTSQTLLPQHVQQLQLQIQQLCQQFPHLTQQDASQLIPRIPAHYRQIQQLDNAQRSTPQQSPHNWQQQPQQPGQQPAPQAAVQSGQYPPMSPHGRPIPGRPMPQGYPGCQPGGVVSPGQGSPHMVAGGQLTPQQQLTPHVSPLASPHGHSPIHRGDGTLMGHPGAIQGSPVPQNLVNQQNLVNPKTKTALAIHLTNRGVISQGPQGPIEVPPHVVQKPGLPQEAVQGPGGEPVMLYQRRALGNITGSVTNNLVRPPAQGAPVGIVGGHGYPRPAPPPHPAAATPPMAPTTSHYPRPHLVGHDINIMYE
ncbi:putative extensin [Penaeus vannamei]|uniref:Putative extensin n=1 Tax=Penaeus vannamei TaxID=6689 RepID=A0A3R7MIG0_PENVA|nr:putative extensin [Penaeus vannamei]